MKFQLENIGIIEKADIDLCGLTVITGKNNAGKSTIGKALYAVIEGGRNIPEKYDNDLKSQIYNVLFSVVRDFSELRAIVRQSRISDKANIEIENIFSDYKEIWNIINFRQVYANNFSTDEIEELIHELDEFDVKKLFDEINIVRQENGQNVMRFRSKDESQIHVKNTQKKLEQILNKINQSPDYESYTRESINSVLTAEFLNQIQPIKWNVENSSICIRNEKDIIAKVIIKENKVVRSRINDFDNNFDRVIMIDNPMILDDLDVENSATRYMLFDDDDFLSSKDLNHISSLKRLIHNPKSKTVLEHTEIAKQTAHIEEKLGKMISGNFTTDTDGRYLVSTDGKKLRISNMATGAKMVAILTILLREGMIKKNTVLILDEPESHLHPEWQNIFAEIIVMLMKEIGVKIIMTTHSPNFFYALDTYARKYHVLDRCSFYQAICQGNGHSLIEDVSNDVGKIYSDFLNYLLEMKDLRNKLDEQ